VTPIPQKVRVTANDGILEIFIPLEDFAAATRERDSVIAQCSASIV